MGGGFDWTADNQGGDEKGLSGGGGGWKEGIERWW